MIQLDPLPYDLDGLEPYISKATLEFHYHKHHQGYVQKVKDLVHGTKAENCSLEEVIEESFRNQNLDLFNNSAQIFNHNFYWKGLCSPKKNCTYEQEGPFAKAVKRDFGSLEGLKEKLKTGALQQFGSGWSWLVSQEGVLEVVRTPNGDLPTVHGKTPLFVIDVWEHAYYLDYQNRRVDHVDALLAHLVNWQMVEERFKKHLGIA
jgi:superoxide dismutase, Fe-Mn family